MSVSTLVASAEGNMLKCWRFQMLFFCMYWKVTEGKSLEDLLATTEPLEEYLANAGCLRPLRRLEDKNLLVDDILMFQVIHRVRGPFERYIFILSFLPLQ